MATFHTSEVADKVLVIGDRTDRFTSIVSKGELPRTVRVRIYLRISREYTL